MYVYVYTYIHSPLSLSLSFSFGGGGKASAPSARVLGYGALAEGFRASGFSGLELHSWGIWGCLTLSHGLFGQRRSSP